MNGCPLLVIGSNKELGILKLLPSFYTHTHTHTRWSKGRSRTEVAFDRLLLHLVIP